MTNQKLIKANDLQNDINCIDSRLRDIKKCLKEIELTDNYSTFEGNIVELRLDSKDCRIDKQRLISFLTNELDLETKISDEFQKEFDSL